MIIRKASEEDLPALIGLAGEYLQELAKIKDSQFDLDVFTRSVRWAMHSPDEAILLLIKEGELVGGIWASSGYLEVYSSTKSATDRLLFIKQNRRGLGGFQRLIKAYENWAKEQLCTKIYLTSVSGIKPEKTQRLYSRSGYAQEGFVHSL